MIIKIKIPTRLHITLISMHDKGYRQNGGIGFTIDAPSLEIHFKQSSTLSIEDTRVEGFTRDEKKRILDILNTTSLKMSFDFRYEAIIKGNVPTHMGFGSSTAIRLALIEGLYLVNNRDYTQEEVVKSSERGGVSGIGIETYFGGGFVFDMGRRYKSDFAPSSAMETREKTLPLLCKRVNMPQWQIGICIPSIKPKTEKEEKSFFNKICPIAEEESYKTLYHASYGVLASVMEGDHNTFAEAIKHIQTCYWKGAERLLYGDALINEENILYECGAHAVGMSSLGASLYFVADDISKVVNKAKQQLKNSIFYEANVNNKGRIISHD